jgi:hypothetical protein
MPLAFYDQTRRLAQSLPALCSFTVLVWGEINPGT